MAGTGRRLLAAALLSTAWIVQAAEAPPVDVPVPEHVADSPPTGIVLAPGLTFSGYATLQLLAPGSGSGGEAEPAGSGRRPDDDAQYSRRSRLDLSHLSAITWWEPDPAWKVLGEVDLQDVVQVPHHEDEDGFRSSSYVALDRLYADYHATDSLTLRAGKFLTPIGQWNQEHSDPLVWTVLRPLISQSSFPTSATGLMALGSVPVSDHWLDYQVYGADGGGWRPDPRSPAFDKALGLRLSTSLPGSVRLGLSFSRFNEADFAADKFTLVGVDAEASWRHVDFSGEAIRRQGSGGHGGNESGWFAQVVAPVAQRWWAVGRVEAYHRAGEPAGSRTALAGVVYKSGRHWVFKAEWAKASGQSQGLPSGFLSSVTLVY